MIQPVRLRRLDDDVAIEHPFRGVDARVRRENGVERRHRAGLRDDRTDADVVVLLQLPKRL
jgi:hypothetical protein